MGHALSQPAKKNMYVIYDRYTKYANVRAERNFAYPNHGDASVSRGGDSGDYRGDD